MKISKHLVATAMLVASVSASASAGAQVWGQKAAGPLGSFLALSGPGACFPFSCTLGGTVGSIMGGTVYASDQGFADIPAGSIFGPRFLAAGPSSGPIPSTLTFSGAGVKDIGFLWGSPDLRNSLRVYFTPPDFGVDYLDFTPSILLFAETEGAQNFSQYVSFTAENGFLITKLEFTNVVDVDAFEAANFSTSVIPEPATYALMATGLVALGLVSKRRKQV